MTASGDVPPRGDGGARPGSKRARREARGGGPAARRSNKSARRTQGAKRAKRRAAASREGSGGAASKPRARRDATPSQSQPTSLRGGGEDPEARATFFDLLGEYAPLAGVRTDSGVFVVATSDRHIGRHLFIKRGRPEFRVLGRAVAVVEILAGERVLVDQVFVDVGANIGTTSVCALVSHRFGSAVSCEPEKGNHRLLQANLLLNGLDDAVRSMRVAVSDRPGHADLVIPEESAGFSWIALDRERIADIERGRRRRQAGGQAEELAIDVAEVEVVSLDQLVETGAIEPASVGMLWIDVEGHEGHVLQGASALAERGVPTVFEFDPAGLDERGDRGKVHEIAQRSYTHFVDVRRPEQDRTQPRFRLRSLTELAGYAERFLDPSNPGNHTDLLLLRLDSDQAKLGEDLPELMSGRHRHDDDGPPASQAD